MKRFIAMFAVFLLTFAQFAPVQAQAQSLPETAEPAASEPQIAEVPVIAGKEIQDTSQTPNELTEPKKIKPPEQPVIAEPSLFSSASEQRQIGPMYLSDEELPKEPIVPTIGCDTVEITELMPDPVNVSDSEGEFIELHNYGNLALNIKGCSLKSGKNLAYESKFLADVILLPDEYRAFYGKDHRMNLPNSSLNDQNAKVRLVNSASNTINETAAYTSAALGGKSWALINNVWQVASEPTPGAENPIPLETPIEAASCNNDVIINEVYSDPVGLESNGGEFIELYNPGSEAKLTGCKITSNKSQTLLQDFTDQDIIPAGGFFVIKTIDKLTNASGSITFIAKDREEVVNYVGVSEGQSYANFADGWKLTDQPTPGLANRYVVLSEEEVQVARGQASGALAPCPVGKYRNPATGRCKNIETDNALEPCEPGEYRNPATGRCKKVATSASAVLMPCGPGEERNPLTNRCRKVATAAKSATLAPCQPGYERNPETNRCRKIVNSNSKSKTKADDNAAASAAAVNPISVSPYVLAVTGAATLAYGAFEYRGDIVNILARFRSLLGK